MSPPLRYPQHAVKKGETWTNKCSRQASVKGGGGGGGKISWRGKKKESEREREEVSVYMCMNKKRSLVKLQ